ncbi:MAG: hypothetical protein IPK64_15900 [bacterium]|nr:hypothetical protein [bacterium]
MTTRRRHGSWQAAATLVPTLALLLALLPGCDGQDNDWDAYDPTRKLLTVATDSLRLAEGGEGRALVFSLQMVPDDTVFVELAADGGQAVAEPATLVFAPDDDEWSRPRTAVVTAVDDDLDEGAHKDALTVLAVSRDADYDGQGGPGLVPLAVTDNDRAGVAVSATFIELVEAPPGVLERAYELVLTSQPTAAVTVVVTATPADPYFHLTPSTLTFTPADWSVAQSVTLWAELDQDDADDLTVTLSHAAASGDPRYGPSLAIADVTVQVYDNTLPPIARLRPAGGGAALDLDEAVPGTTADVEIVLDHPSLLPVRLHLATVDGTAIGGQDYQAVDLDVTFAPGDPIVQTVPLRVIDDALLEDPEHFEVVLTGLANVIIGDDDRLGCTIADNDLTTLTLTVLPAAEDGGSAQFVVTIPSPQPLPVDFTFTTAAGTATSGVDFEPVAAAYFIAPGQTQRVIPVVLRADPYHEGDESFTANLTNVSTNAVWGGVPVVATIVDDDPQAIALDGVTVGEAGGAAVFTLRLQAPYDAPVSLTVSTLAGDGLGAVAGQEDAAAGSDYTAVTGAAWVIPVAATTATFSVTLQAGTAAEAISEFFRLRIDAGSRPGFAGLVATAEVIDDDQPYLAVADVAVPESAAVATFTVRLVNALGAAVTSTGDVTFRADTVDQTATAGSDYTAVGAVFTVPAGQGSLAVPVTLADDAWDDDSETFVLHLSAPANALLDPEEADAFCAITDDEFPSINLGTALARANEGSTLVFTVSLTTTRQAATTFTLAVLPGTTGGSGVDYTFTAGGAQVIPPFTPSISFSVPLLDDQLAGEPDEVLRATIANANVALGVIALDLTVVDAPELSIAAAPAVVEGAPAVFPVTMDAPSTAPVSFRVQFSSATASIVSDINPAGTGPFTIPAGTVSVNVPVPTIAGDGGDLASETFTTTLISPANATLSGFNAASGTILDGDPSPLSFSDDAFAIEGDAIVFTVQTAWTSEAAITFSVQFTDGTAAGSGIDYVSAGTGPFTIPAGQPSVTVSVPTVDDAGPELAAEAFTIRVVNPTNAVIGAAPTATGRVLDNDQPVLTITAGPAVLEGGTLSFTVSMDRQTIVPVTFDVAFLNGSTQGAVDFTTPAGPWTLVPGTTSIVIDVPTVQDTEHENQEIFVARLAADPVNAVVGAPPEANGVIDDDDP